MTVVPLIGELFERANAFFIVLGELFGRRADSAVGRRSQKPLPARHRPPRDDAYQRHLCALFGVRLANVSHDARGRTASDDPSLHAFGNVHEATQDLVLEANSQLEFVGASCDCQHKLWPPHVPDVLNKKAK